MVETLPPVLDGPEPLQPRWKRVLGHVAGVFLGAVLLVGLYAKVLHPAGFVRTIEEEGLDFLLSAGVVAAIGLTMEAILGFCLVLGLRRLRVLLPTAALVVFFLLLTGRAYWRFSQGGVPDDASCGCFGSLVERTPAEAFWQDLFLLVPPLLVAFLARPTRAAPHTRARFVTAIGLTVAVLVFAWFAPDLPLDDWATRLRPGTETGDICSGEGDGRICMDTVIPELGEGSHVVLLITLDDPRFQERLPAFNDYALEGRGPALWVVVPATEEEVAAFKFLRQPAFEVVHCPPAVVRPLYRRLPRTFLTRGGTVTKTWQDWPPLGQLARDAAGPDDGHGDDGAAGDDPDAKDDK